ncbi:MAG: sigma-54-dependent Fis family transcriptional regulator [Bacteroidales bacterium]|jgi:DNA-binding NtrC family response regulator|nr:sigma-54-dependent Fis family transcriptional regulator [Bacteroidales bacterium]MBP5419861.1 sigma-54-dependent Fis family transcriptional regulator [Bacteroidales bacterium]MCR5695817.1 sigma-54 dependent transcriptional regulator [Marinilabiliaceae bacterium]
MANILVIDDQRSIRTTLKDILEYENNTVELAENGQEGIDKFKAGNFDVVLTDIKMPEMDGMEVLSKIMAEGSDVPVIMISGHGNIDTAVEAIKKGAYDFIEKPLDLNRLLITVKNAIDKKGLVVETKVLKRKVSKTYEMVGNSEPMAKMRELIEKVAPTDARVLILGANGTGKELVARALHEGSSRANGPFVEVNCAAIPSELIESELFGHEKGAFTSAIKQRIGKFEQANGGTIFLDEIGDMSLAAQAKVLRALQENTITRVGSDKDVKVDVRVLAATNKNLVEEIKANNFREDLYHRLSVIIINVPSLNDRKDDIPLLAEHFLSIVSQEMNVPTKKITPEAIAELQKINWTGNIREFRNVIERLTILSAAEVSAKDVIDYARPIS